VRRTREEAQFALREQVKAWATGQARPGLRVFVYPPEWEAAMLAWYPAFAAECAAAGWPIELVDVGAGFLAEVERRRGFVDGLARLERDDRDRLLHDLGMLGSRYVQRALTTPLPDGVVGRLVVNTGALSTFVSYSPITNDLHGADAAPDSAAGRSILAFPGEDDEKSLNLLRLRADTAYRIPRV
jgi:hypothetical protein